MENSSIAEQEFEYYYEYLDPVIVDQSKLKFHKYSLVIVFWVVLASFMGFLFLGLSLSSRTTLPRVNRSQVRRPLRSFDA